MFLIFFWCVVCFSVGVPKKKKRKSTSDFLSHFTTNNTSRRTSHISLQAGDDVGARGGRRREDVVDLVVDDALRVVERVDGRDGGADGRDERSLGLHVAADGRDLDADGLDVDALGLDVASDRADVDEAGLS